MRPGEACRAASIVLGLVRPVRGGAPEYTPLHVARALEALAGGPVGRPRLQAITGLSEASLKTLIRRLRSAGLAESRGRRGHVLSGEGARVLEALRALIAWEEMPEGAPPELEGLRVLRLNWAEPPGDLVSVYRVRDSIVERACKTAVIGGWSGGEVLFPGLPESLNSWLRRSLRPPQGVNRGVYALTPEECAPKAYHALLEVALGNC